MQILALFAQLGVHVLLSTEKPHVNLDISLKKDPSTACRVHLIKPVHLHLHHPLAMMENTSMMIPNVRSVQKAINA